MLINTSLMVGEVGSSESAGLFMIRIPPFSTSDSYKAVLHFLVNVRLAKERGMLVLAVADLSLGSLYAVYRVLPSLTSSFRSPLDQLANLLSRHLV